MMTTLHHALSCVPGAGWDDGCDGGGLPDGSWNLISSLNYHEIIEIDCI